MHFNPGFVHLSRQFVHFTAKPATGCLPESYYKNVHQLKTCQIEVYIYAKGGEIWFPCIVLSNESFKTTSWNSSKSLGSELKLYQVKNKKSGGKYNV
jgi:hypothetical protein